VGLFSAAVGFSNLRFRFRRAIFCLRTRLNLDLSPFKADIDSPLTLRQLVYDRSGKTRLSLWMPVGTAGELTDGVRSPIKMHAFEYLRSVTGNMDCGLWVDDTKQTPLDLSIAKARILWRIFEVK
jgi:hypothetical protein